MLKKILAIALVLTLSAAMVTVLSCKKKEGPTTTATTEGGPTTPSTTPPAPPPPIMEDPIQYVAKVDTIVQTISTNTAIKQAVSCLDAAYNLLYSTGDENLIVLLCTKTLTLIEAISPSFPSYASKFDTAIADLQSLINTLQMGGLVNATTWQAALKNHKNFLAGLITTTTTTTTSDKKLSDFYSKDELDKMKLKFKEYGDNLKKKYAEMNK